MSLLFCLFVKTLSHLIWLKDSLKYRNVNSYEGKMQCYIIRTDKHYEPWIDMCLDPYLLISGTWDRWHRHQIRLIKHICLNTPWIKVTSALSRSRLLCLERRFVLLITRVSDVPILGCDFSGKIFAERVYSSSYIIIFCMCTCIYFISFFSAGKISFFFLHHRVLRQ